MNINDLDKNQIILLTLLVSFVTSIATGIVTVTLLDQAPAGVTQTINQVVERTIERVVPTDTGTPTIVEVPIIVTEEELIVDIINKTIPSVVKIVDFDDPNSTLGTGFFVGVEGYVVTKSNLVENSNRTYGIVLETGKRVEAKIFKRNNESGVSTLVVNTEDIKVKESEEAEEVVISPLVVSAESVSVGQTVIAFGSSEPNTGGTVSVGIVAGFYKDPETGVTSIKTNATNQINIGGPLINIKGEVIGMNSVAGTSISTDVINSEIDAIPE